MDMVVSRHFPGSSTLCSLGLPPHVGRGDAAVVRSTRSESLFDLNLDHEAAREAPSRILSLRGNRGRGPAARTHKPFSWGRGAHMFVSGAPNM